MLRAFLLSLLFATTTLADTLTVSAAISLKEPLTAIAADFTKETGHDLRLSFGSSGQLFGQIKNGAPVDLFISAASKQIDDLERLDLLVKDSRRTIATNALVLIVPADAKDPPTTFEDLAHPRFRRIAIGDPRTVPAGDYAMQTLASLKLTQKLAPRLVTATNVRQALDYVERNEAAAGIVYLTDARSSDKVKIAATAAPSTHQPIVYPAAIMKTTKSPAAARKFLDYLAAEKARKTLADAGFTLNEPSK
jgi:molybdate transport system substrate-binding protein